MTAKKINNQGSRFILVGAVNTAIDFGILNLLAWFGTPAIIANTISTGTAMLFSFFANKKFTFKSNSKNYIREVILFFVFTLFGLWVLQNLVIQTVAFVIPESWPEFVVLNGAKVIATIVSMTWNFFTYRKVVFASPSKPKDTRRYPELQ